MLAGPAGPTLAARQAIRQGSAAARRDAPGAIVWAENGAAERGKPELGRGRPSLSPSRVLSVRQKQRAARIIPQRTRQAAKAENLKILGDALDDGRTKPRWRILQRKTKGRLDWPLIDRVPRLSGGRALIMAPFGLDKEGRCFWVPLTNTRAHAWFWSFSVISGLFRQVGRRPMPLAAAPLRNFRPGSPRQAANRPPGQKRSA